MTDGLIDWAEYHALLKIRDQLREDFITKESEEDRFMHLYVDNEIRKKKEHILNVIKIRNEYADKQAMTE